MDQTQLKAPSHPPADTPLPGESTSEQDPQDSPQAQTSSRERPSPAA